ncbi:MAG: histidinol-phosphate aminotransferase family protein, partial [Candidatus Marinimicrobia bacterium]|nr:histidinol-phosphate aminotransferase family protein [Candidatus Neomarinimicrobiota bacterium]
MKENLTRRQWLNTGATILGGSILGSVAGVSPLKAATKSLPSAPIRMMFNENPYGPSQVARRAMRKA